MLLFVILFFIYPLKYVFGTAIERILLHAGFPGMTNVQPLGGPGMSLLFVAFSLGWMAVLGVFALLYQHAYSLRDKLELSPIEIMDTAQSVWRCRMMILPGLISATMNLIVYLKPSFEDPIAYGGVTVLVLVALFVRQRARGFRRQRREALAALREPLQT